MVYPNVSDWLGQPGIHCHFRRIWLMGLWSSLFYHWFQLKWMPVAASHSIAFLELVPIVISGLVWGKYWKGAHVLCKCDNLATVEIIKSRYSRDDNLMHLLRCLFFVEVTFNFSYIPKHLPGRLNEVADALSHNNLSLPCCKPMAWN